MPISLTTLGHPTVLACGSTALLTLSGVWLKLANAQTLTSRYPDKPPLLVSTNGDMKSLSFSPVYCRQELGLVDGRSGRVFERSEFSTTPSAKFNFWIKGNFWCPFVWFVYFGQTK
ncbi:MULTISPECIES: hypothetical protein [unclassified Methylophaga]|uniref:hypothetical protein n=1 Tax=unclassified Methylophaga TaxID=2629249 RepID=UPI00259D2979|nr:MULTISPECIES: hypothetical protein [unclassified Methylophaga]